MFYEVVLLSLSGTFLLVSPALCAFKSFQRKNLKGVFCSSCLGLADKLRFFIEKYLRQHGLRGLPISAPAAAPGEQELRPFVFQMHSELKQGKKEIKRYISNENVSDFRITIHVDFGDSAATPVLNTVSEKRLPGFKSKLALTNCVALSKVSIPSEPVCQMGIIPVGLRIKGVNECRALRTVLGSE